MTDIQTAYAILNKTAGRSSEAAAYKSWSPICPPQVNGERSFFIPPDGSKEGWSDSDKGDERRNEFVEWLRSEGQVHWVEVCYAEDESNTRTTRASDMLEDDI